MPFPNFKKPSHILATWFGVGLLRPAPGTWGSLMAAIGWYFLDFLHSWTIIIIPLFVILSLYVCIKADEDSETDDHPSIVIDEVAGMLIALSFVENNFLTLLLSYCPGGIYEVAVIAIAFNLDPNFVTFHHIIRLLMILFTVPVILRLIDKKRSSNS